MYDLEDDEKNIYFCGFCKHFKVNANMDNVQSSCKRIDHKIVQFYRPWFKFYDCNQCNGKICCEFEPAEWCVSAYNNWDGFDNYWNSYKKYYNRNTETDSIAFFLNGNTDVGYRVKLIDFVFGNMYNDDGTLKFYEKFYYKRTKKKSNWI